MEWFANLLSSLMKPLKWWVVVAPWESGLLIRLGKIAHTLNPGIHLCIPFLDRIYVQSVRLRTIAVSNINTMTKDGHSVVVSAAIDFSIYDIKKLYDSLSMPESTLNSRTSELLMKHISKLDKAQLSIKFINNILSLDLNEFGLSSVAIRLTGFTVCKTFRLLQNEYTNGAHLYSLEDICQNGERK